MQPFVLATSEPLYPVGKPVSPVVELEKTTAVNSHPQGQSLFNFSVTADR
ncbi:hypothetical protein [[Phormidium ambiguum] IAM M-71]|nr:hypothetical protein [Phormidium ambiguum]